MFCDQLLSVLDLTAGDAAGDVGQAGVQPAGADRRDVRTLHVYRHFHTGAGRILESLYLCGAALQTGVVVLRIIGGVTGFVDVNLTGE